MLTGIATAENGLLMLLTAMPQEHLYIMQSRLPG